MSSSQDGRPQFHEARPIGRPGGCGLRLLDHGPRAAKHLGVLPQKPRTFAQEPPVSFAIRASAWSTPDEGPNPRRRVRCCI